MLSKDYNKRSPKHKVHNFLDVLNGIHELNQIINTHHNLSIALDSLIQDICNEKTLSCDSKIDKYVVFEICKQLFEPKDMGDALLSNIEMLLEQIAGSENLRKIAPLYLYQVFIKHRKRISSNTDFSFQMAKLWGYTAYKVNEDNGKNFNQFYKSIGIYLELSEIFRKTQDCDLELSLYGFSVLSNICDWYHNNAYDEKHPSIPIPIKKYVQQNFGTCFENGYNEAVLLTENHLNTTDLDCFLQPTSVKYTKIHKSIRDYINQNAYPLSEQFIAQIDAPHKLIARIFDKSNAPTKMIQSSELPIIYTGINLLLLQLVDEVCINRLGNIGERIIRPEV